MCAYVCICVSIRLVYAYVYVDSQVPYTLPTHPSYLEDDDTKRVHVTFGGEFSLGRVLGSEITDGSADGGGEVGVFVQVDGFRQPEIRHTRL